jgi:NTE family protein
MKKALILTGGGGRGAFHIGVWKYLQEQKWTPDLICGTSIGAIIAAAIGSGLSVEALQRIWTTTHRSAVYRSTMLKALAAVLFRRPLRPLLDTTPLREMITRHLDLDALRNSPIEVIITAVNVVSGRLCLFDQDEIDVDRLMASSAMPILFPWQHVDGEPYWDGGVMANTPLFAALREEMSEIIVVLLSPVGHRDLPFPGSMMNGLEIVFEHLLSGSYQATRSAGADRRLPLWQTQADTETPSGAAPRIRVVAPSRMLGFRSLLNFSEKQTRRLLAEGYQNARRQL